MNEISLNILDLLKEKTINSINTILKERNHLNIELHKKIVHARFGYHTGVGWFTHEGLFKIMHVQLGSVLIEYKQYLIQEEDNTCFEGKRLRDLPIEQLAELLDAILNKKYECIAAEY